MGCGATAAALRLGAASAQNQPIVVGDGSRATLGSCASV